MEINLIKRNEIIEIKNKYKNILLNDVIPFWSKYSVDWKYNGFLNCLDQDGSVYCTDKSVWIQNRGVWLFSKLYNEVEHKDEWLDIAKNGFKFIMEHCFDTNDQEGRMFFSVTQDGKPLRKRRYYFSEIFGAIAFAEYAKAANSQIALKKARTIYRLIVDFYRNNSRQVSSKINPKTRLTKTHAVPMIILATTQCLRKIDNNPLYDEISEIIVDEIFKDFVKENEHALFETVGINGERLDSPQGRCINPGHAIETSWFLMEEGRYRNDKNLINKACQILDWSLNWGWDKKFGGILYFVDIESRPPEQLEWDMKLWWPHTEALYATLLAYKLTKKDKYKIWHKRIHEWAFNHFPDKQYGEWFGYLHRDGSISLKLKGNLWKGPFHLPRALLLCWKLLDEMLQNNAI